MGEYWPTAASNQYSPSKSGASIHENARSLIMDFHSCYPTLAQQLSEFFQYTRQFNQPLTAADRAFSLSRKITYEAAQIIVMTTKIIPMTFTAGVRPKRIREPISVTKVWEPPMENIVVL